MTIDQHEQVQKDHRKTLDTDQPNAPVFLDPVSDTIMEVFLELAAELWVTRSRLDHLEQLLEIDGQPAAEALENTPVDPEHATALAAKREQYIQRVFRAITEL